MTALAIEPARLRNLLTRERETFAREHPRSLVEYERARGSLFGGVPMTWMNKAAGGFPLFLAEAHGARVHDLDGHEYVDFALGDTGAMSGHSPAATVAAVREQAGRGITAMLPTEDAVVSAEELARRFGVPQWQFTLSATDSNRHVIRYARHITGRSKVLVIDYC